MKKVYAVLSQVELDGHLLTKGDLVELSDDQAAYLLDKGAIELAPPAAARSAKAGAPAPVPAPSSGA